MKKIIVFILIWGGFLEISAQISVFPKDEEFTYSGYYNWGIIWMRAGIVTFRVEESEKYPDALKLEAVGTSLPSWDWMFKMRDTLITHFNQHTFLPYEFSRKAHEGSYHKTFDYLWDYDNNRIFADIHKIDRYKKRDTIPLQPDTYDMLSVAWKARGLDFDSYHSQDTIPIKILLDDKIHDLYVRFLGTDEIKIGGKKRDAYVFSPLLVKGDVFKGGEGMKIWVSKDENRIPLMVEAKILVGSVKGILEVKK
ncbi:DUF3108 domain-containing protein [Odoribacter lunatus]|uniref:DUF3108 domain-containing protein n=1 Tax=Odoribacter lunatus TaxID=2941335 RepID=UPI00203FF266|nr:DUF3108 domain-containing protein [Odoribacter lunatus]